MKKVLLGILLTALPMSVFSQLKVNSDGTVLTGSGNYRPTGFSSANVKLESYSPATGGLDNVAIQGAAYITSPSSGNKAVGVLGIGGNGAAGHNMGVLGYLGGSQNGAGVFGTTYSNLNYTIPGMYAGFFNGEVYATEKISGTSFYTISDLRLKENVIPVAQKETDYTFLDRVLDMNVIEYNLKDRSSAEEPNERMAELRRAELGQRHIGLAAQELQKLFPELVSEGQDGYLTVNYMELVPVLIRSIQELKSEIDGLKGAAARTRGTADINKETLAGRAILYQNTPNPFREQTIIRFSLADNVQDASICIFDLSGKMLKKYPVSSGMESVSVAGYELGEGMFLYSLIVNGQEVDTKKMVITK